ncbi:MAG: peptidase T [Solobacterium sp.]|nr:peptidase T [Solobacterium sp.]
MSSVERFIRYIKIDTQSDPKHSDVVPSTQKQFDLAKVLYEELKEMGLSDVRLDEHCYVYGKLPSNLDHPAKRVGFIAHMDTAPDYSGTNVNPRIIENYDGGDIELCEGVVTKVKDFPQMPALKGKSLIVTDGSTLLGADDKAGITAIMEAVSYLVSHPEVKHGDIAVGFTPDEEIGNGPKYFDVENFGADFAYTLDGGQIRYLCDETFNAAAAVIDITGFSIHPGSAKGKMINAASMAAMLHSYLPAYMRPEHTDGYDGFFHLTELNGNMDRAHMEYIIRDHNAAKLEAKKEILRKAVDYLNEEIGTEAAVLTITDSYRNMKEILDKNPEVSEYAWKAIQDLGLEPGRESARGGTDGATLTYMGLPCPNLGTGGGNAHGRYEYVVIEEMEKAAELVLRIVERVGSDQL